MRCIVHCAKDGERLGCVLSSRVPGRRDALHEHALKLCAAHPGFSAKLEFDIFWLLKPCRSIFLSVCCVHCLQVLRFERGNANGKQSNTIIAAQLFQSLHRHTVPTENNTYQWISVASIWLKIIFYIVHLCLVFQTVETQNPKHECVQLPCCKHGTWTQWDNTWMLREWLMHVHIDTCGLRCWFFG